MRSAVRLIVGVDFSPGSRRALSTARRLAARTGASLTVVHVRPFSDVRAAVVEERGDLLRLGARGLARSMAEHYARRLDELTHQRRRETWKLLRGQPDVALCREASRRYDALVLGRHGRGSVSSLLLGSTALRVLARSRRPVLIVPAR